MDTFITLNISTETEKGRGPKYPPPQRVELKIFLCVTRDLIEELGEKLRLPSGSSRSSTIMPCAITLNICVCLHAIHCAKGGRIQDSLVPGFGAVYAREWPVFGLIMSHWREYGTLVVIAHASICIQLASFAATSAAAQIPIRPTLRSRVSGANGWWHIILLNHTYAIYQREVHDYFAIV